MKYLLNPILWLIIILVYTSILIIYKLYCIIWTLNFKTLTLKHHIKKLSEIKYFEPPFTLTGGYADGNEY